MKYVSKKKKPMMLLKDMEINDLFQYNHGDDWSCPCLLTDKPDRQIFNIKTHSIYYISQETEVRLLDYELDIKTELL